MNERRAGQRRPEGSPDAQQFPFVSVVIPALNEAAYIEATLRALVNQTYPSDRYELLVVDGGSSDHTRELAQNAAADSHVSIRVLNNPKRFAGPARNIGLRAARGEYVLFVDAHVHIASTSLLMDMARAAVSSEAMVLARPQPMDAPGLNGIQEVIGAVRSSTFGHSPESFIYSRLEGWVSPLSVGVMYHRSIFERFGEFDERFDAAEDLEFNYRLEKAGISAYISPRFSISYYPRSNLRGLFHQMFRYGCGRVRFLRKHPERFRPDILVPSLVIVLLPLLLALLYTTAIGSALLWLLPAGAGLAYCCLRRARFAMHCAACLVVVHAGLAAGTLFGMAQRE